MSGGGERGGWSHAAGILEGAVLVSIVYLRVLPLHTQEESHKEEERIL